MTDEAHSLPPEESLIPKNNVLNLEYRLVDTFFRVIEDRSLMFLLLNPELCSDSDAETNISPSKKRNELYELFTTFKDRLSNYGTKKLPDQLSYRIVSFEDISQVNQVIKQSEINGGKGSGDSVSGVCVSTTDKALEMAKHRFANKESGALFIYDQSKLRPLTKAEMGNNESLSEYGVKPVDGLELNNALVCIIKLKNINNKRIY